MRLVGDKYITVVVNYPYLKTGNKQYSLEELVEMVDKIVVEKKVVMLGFSMGGLVASRYATRYPNKVKKLILVSSSTSLVLSTTLKVFLFWAKIVVRSKWITNGLTKIFLSTKNMDWLPLPKPEANFRTEQGWAVFGTLTKVIGDDKKADLPMDKEAILFEDDIPFPSGVYCDYLKERGFEVISYTTGGHAVGKDYWDKVAKGMGIISSRY